MLYRFSFIVFPLALFFSISSCASTQVQVGKPLPEQQRLAKPEQIVVYDFAVSKDGEGLNLAENGGVSQSFNKRQSVEANKLAVDHAVAVTLSNELVKELRALGLPAVRKVVKTEQPKNTLIITGYFIDIEQGKRLRRMVIGLGAGSSEVKAQVQVFDQKMTPSQLLTEFSTTAKSSLKPGMAELVGVGAAATGHVGVSLAVSAGIAVASEALGANVQAEARRTAKTIVQQLKPFFVQQGWVFSKSY